MNPDRLLKEYDYKLPPERIAAVPAAPRDAARLLVYDRENGKISFDRFSNLGKYLPPDAVLVINDTRVVPARMIAEKRSGGKVELFYVGKEGKNLRVLANRKLEQGEVLALGKSTFTIVGCGKKWYLARPSFPTGKIFDFLSKHGQTPLPPYLKRSPLTEAARRREYQTVFAAEKGSVAAPTASLHFTKRLLAKLEKRGVKIVRVTLHVNLGTFAPLTREQIESGRLHAEEYEISPNAARELIAAKSAGRKIIAVGTTSCRTLESASRNRRSGTTDIFIRPPYRFKTVDGLITNFHVPRSSLLMLVASLVGRKRLFSLYALALKKKMRFLSFGDGMLIL